MGRASLSITATPNQAGLNDRSMMSLGPREQLPKQPLLRGLVAGQHALELLAQFGRLVGAGVNPHELAELLLHRRIAFPAGHGGGEVQVLPFWMVARIVLQP